MKPFSEKLDQFVERGADRSFSIYYKFLSNGEGHCATERCCALRSGYKSGASSLKPIVLKLVEALEGLSKISFPKDKAISGEDLPQYIVETNMNHAAKTLAEVSQMLEGGSK